MWRDCLCRNVVQGRFHLLSSKNIPLPIKHEHGSGCYLKHLDGRIKRQVRHHIDLSVIQGTLHKPFYGRVFQSQSVATRSAAHLQRIYWNPATISAPAKSFSVIAMFQQPLWFTSTLSTAVVVVFKALSTECDLSLSYLVKIVLIWLLVSYSGEYDGRKIRLFGEVSV